MGLTSEFPIHLKEKIFEVMYHGTLHCQTAGIDFLVVDLHPPMLKISVPFQPGDPSFLRISASL